MENIKDRNNRTVNLWNTRKYQGIKVADIQDIIDYGNQYWGGGGEGGYQPDYTTIGLTTNNELAVIGYISATQVANLDNQVKSWVEDNYCLESFAVELDGRLEDVEEKLTLPEEQGSVHLDYADNHLYAELDSEIESKIDRALLVPITTPTSTELVGVGTDKSQKRVKIGSGLSYDTNTDTLSATGGGGSGTPTFNITGDLDYQAGTITITSGSYKSQIEQYKQENGYYPIVKLSLRVVVSGSVVQTGDYQANDIQVISNNLNIWFVKTELDATNKLEVSQIKFVDTGSVMSATFSDMSTESFDSSKYYDTRTIDETFATKTSLSSLEHDLRYDYYTKDDVQTILDNFYRRSEADSTFQKKTDNDLTTTDKTVVGAINEVNGKIPTRTSQLTNDSNFTVKSYVDTQVNTKSPKLYLHHLTVNTGSQPYSEEWRNATFRIMLVDSSSESFTETSQFTQNWKKGLVGTLTKSGGSEVANFNPLKKSGLSVLYFTKADGTEISFSPIELVGSITSDTVVNLS